MTTLSVTPVSSSVVRVVPLRSWPGTACFPPVLGQKVWSCLRIPPVHRGSMLAVLLNVVNPASSCVEDPPVSASHCEFHYMGRTVCWVDMLKRSRWTSGRCTFNSSQYLGDVFFAVLLNHTSAWETHVGRSTGGGPLNCKLELKGKV